MCENYADDISRAIYTMLGKKINGKHSAKMQDCAMKEILNGNLIFLNLLRHMSCFLKIGVSQYENKMG